MRKSTTATADTIIRPITKGGHVHQLPYRQKYARVLIALAIFSALLFPLVPASSDEVTLTVRLILWTFGVSISCIIAPAILYAGLRTKNWVDALMGLLGTLPLCFWLPWIIYH